MDVTSNIRKSSEAMKVGIAEDQEAGDGDDLAESSLTTLPLGRLIFSVAKKVP